MMSTFKNNEDKLLNNYIFAVPDLLVDVFIDVRCR